MDVSWNERPEAWNCRGCHPHLPWNGHPRAWNWRGTRAEPQDRRAVELSWNWRPGAWNCRGTGPRGALWGVELAWNCRGTAVEVALRAAKQPGAERSAPNPLFLWRVVWKRGAHLSPFPVRRAVLPSGHIHAPGPPVAPDHEGIPQWSEGGQKGDTPAGAPRSSFQRQLGAGPSPAMERLSWPVPLWTSRWTSVSPRVPRLCPACCCPRFPVHRRQKSACARTPRPWWSSLTTDARDAGSP